MSDYAEVARAETERGELVLRRRTSEVAADVLELRANGVWMTDTLETTREIELAALALAAVDRPRRVVIGGLRLGHILQRVLADTRVESASVVEIEDRLIGWMRDGTVPYGPALLADQRVTIINADVAMAIAEARSTYDLLLLGVDDVEVHGSTFLTQCAGILSPAGVLVIWSADPAPSLLTAMREVFGAAHEQHHHVLRKDRRETYVLCLARRSPSNDQPSSVR